MYIRRYSAPLTVLAAGVLGFSLICLVSAAALANPATTTASEIEPIKPKDIVDSAFAKPINTAVAMTVVEMAEYITSPTPTFDRFVTPSPAGGTATLRTFITWTPVPPTRTRHSDSPPTETKVPSQPPPAPATNTATATHIPPTLTPTRVPDTNTPRPTDTDTPVPTPDTPTQPPDIPTYTPGPPTSVPPTDTPEPPPTVVQIVETSTP